MANEIVARPYEIILLIGKRVLKLNHKITAVFLFGLYGNTAFASAPEAYPSLQKFLTSLNAAAQQKDKAFVYARVAADYRIYRDFGGVYEEAASNIDNFSYPFQFDNSKLSPEYKDHGWEAFGEAISIEQFQMSPNSKAEVCEKISYDENEFPNQVLCFKQRQDKTWVISSIINGGD